MRKSAWLGELGLEKMAGWHVVRLASSKYIVWMPVDAHAKEGSDVDIVRHNVFRCFFFKVSNGITGWKKCVEEHTHTPITVFLMSDLDNHIKKT